MPLPQVMKMSARTTSLVTSGSFRGPFARPVTEYYTPFLFSAFFLFRPTSGTTSQDVVFGSSYDSEAPPSEECDDQGG